MEGVVPIMYFFVWFAIRSVLSASAIGYENDDRIIGGIEAKKNAYPFMVSLQLKEYEIHVCGGTLLNEQYILTAAHCVYYPKLNTNYTAEELHVFLGEHNLYRREGTEVVRDIVKIKIHETYPNGPSKFDSDMALLKMAEPVEFSDVIQPICINSNHDVIGQMAKAIGWGQTEDSLSSSVLLETEIPVIENNLCEKAYRRNYYAEHMLCAGYPTKPHYKDICSGDSGGPLFITSSDGKSSQIGTVSFTSAFGCALKGYPSAYTKLSEFHQWLRDNSENEICFSS